MHDLRFRDALKLFPAGLRLLAILWLASTLHALGDCNGFIDMDRASEPGYALTCADMVKGKCGLAVTFDDMRPPSPVIDPGFDRSGVEQEVLRVFPAGLPVFNRSAAQGNLHRLSARKQELLKDML